MLPTSSGVLWKHVLQGRCRTQVTHAHLAEILGVRSMCLLCAVLGLMAAACQGLLRKLA